MPARQGSMELFKNTNYDFLGKKWPFIIASLVLTVAGFASILMQGGLKFGIDFKGGTLMTVKFSQKPPLEQIRTSAPMAEPQLQKVVADILDFRDTPPRSGLVTDFNQLSSLPGVNAGIMSTLKQECYLAPYTVKKTEMVGPKVGAELRNKAVLATLYALAGMLAYIAFRFEWIYGIAAVIAVFHDTLITIGLFSIFHEEISMTVIAALLTLVGYSMNDTIVIFDRIRENLKIMRREPLESLMNKSVNQTLSRTIMSAGLTFLTVVALFIWGGPVLH